MVYALLFFRDWRTISIVVETNDCINKSYSSETAVKVYTIQFNQDTENLILNMHW